MLDIGLPEVLVILVAALFIFGPERLPEMAAKAGKLVRELRSMAAGAKADLSQAMGPELAELAELRKLGRLDLDLLADLDPRKEISDAVRSADPTRPSASANGSGANGSAVNGAGANGSAANGTGPAQAAPPPAQPRFDADAT